MGCGRLLCQTGWLDVTKNIEVESYGCPDSIVAILSRNRSGDKKEYLLPPKPRVVGGAIDRSIDR